MKKEPTFDDEVQPEVTSGPEQQLQKAKEEAQKLLKMPHSATENDRELVQQVTNDINDIFEWGLKTEQHFWDALLILNELACNYDSPQTLCAALDVLERNLPFIESHVNPRGEARNAPVLRSAEFLVEFGTKEQQDVGKACIRRHTQSILASMEDGLGLPFMQILEIAIGQANEEVNMDALFGLREHLREKPNDSSSMAYCLLSGNRRLRSNAAEILAGEIMPFGVEPGKAIDAWRMSCKKSVAELSRVITNNLYYITDLERKHQGIARFLSEEFGIYDFSRYPEELLTRQFEERDRTDLPYGVVLYPRHDHNGAFYNTKRALESLGKDLGGIYALRIGEGEDKIEIVKMLRKLNRKYGKQHKISFAVVGGHGTPTSIQLGTDSEWDEKQMIHSSDLNDRRAQRKSYFEENPTLILISCSTGANEGIGQELSRLFGATVIAPKVDTNISNMRAAVNEQGELEFIVEYNQAESSVFTKGNSVKEQA